VVEGADIVMKSSERVISQIVVSEKLGMPDTSTTTRLSVPVFETCRFDGIHAVLET
jgi:hypothetical protein